jgi:hypothetical protein
MAFNGMQAGLVLASAGTQTHRCLLGSIVPRSTHLSSFTSFCDRQHAHKFASSSKVVSSVVLLRVSECADIGAVLNSCPAWYAIWLHMLHLNLRDLDL